MTPRDAFSAGPIPSPEARPACSDSGLPSMVTRGGALPLMTCSAPFLDSQHASQAPLFVASVGTANVAPKSVHRSAWVRHPRSCQHGVSTDERTAEQFSWLGRLGLVRIMAEADMTIRLREAEDDKARIHASIATWGVPS